MTEERFVVCWRMDERLRVFLISARYVLVIPRHSDARKMLTLAINRLQTAVHQVVVWEVGTGQVDRNSSKFLFVTFSL